jgi:NADH-quinone oxidoreductase subunit N
VKRVLAYSSIVHAGYILIGFQVATNRGREASLLYLFSYAFMTIGTFAVITIASRHGDDHHSLDDYRGLALRRPVVGGLLAFFLLAQAGVPATAGFIVKLQIFAAAVDKGEYALAIIGTLAAVVAAVIYLRIAITLFSAPDDAAGAEPADETAALSRPVDLWSGLVLFVAAGMTLIVGVLPGTFMTFAKGATFLL